MNTQDMFESYEQFAHPTDDYGAQDTLYDALVGDISGSMNDTGFDPGKKKRALMHEAARDFLNIKLTNRPQDYIAVVAYHSSATLCCPFLNVGRQYHAILGALDKLNTLPSGGTRLSSGLRIVLDLINKVPRNSAHGAWNGYGPLMLRCLAYSDGHDGCRDWGIRYASQLKEQGVLIETFGIGKRPSDVDETFLKQVASGEGNFIHYCFLGDVNSVRQTFNQLATGTLTFNG